MKVNTGRARHFHTPKGVLPGDYNTATGFILSFTPSTHASSTNLSNRQKL
jgi:hypothetical protein